MNFTELKVAVKELLGFRWHLSSLQIELGAFASKTSSAAARMGTNERLAQRLSAGPRATGWARSVTLGPGARGHQNPLQFCTKETELFLKDS